MLGGLLASIKMNAQRVQRRVNDPALQEIAADLMHMTRQAIQSVREMSEELRPSGLDHLGLASAMQRELRQFAARHALQCQWDTSGTLEGLEIDRATSVFRIFQEALINIAKHAHAGKVWVSLRQEEPNQLSLEIRDDGVGLAPGPHRSDARGLLGMKERARELGGTLDLECAPGAGMSLHLSIPVTP